MALEEETRDGMRALKEVTGDGGDRCRHACFDALSGAPVLKARIISVLTSFSTRQAASRLVTSLQSAKSTKRSAGSRIRAPIGLCGSSLSVTFSVSCASSTATRFSSKVASPTATGGG